MNFFSGTPRDGWASLWGGQKKPRRYCELPPPDYYVPEASFVWGGTTHSYLEKVKRETNRRQRSTVELYNLYTDPFETTNLATGHNIGKYADKIKEIRAWAEAEIGLPPKAVVGQWNTAYEMMLKTTYSQQGLQFIVDSRDWPVDWRL